MKFLALLSVVAVRRMARRICFCWLLPWLLWLDLEELGGMINHYSSICTMDTGGKDMMEE